MANFKLRLKTVQDSRILAGMLLSAALTVGAAAQIPRHLEVAVGPNQQIRILASHVTYGEVLRDLRAKLKWEIEIPPQADELTLSFVRVETAEPKVALAKLLEGSGFGYAFLDEGNKFRNLKVLVIPLAPRETKAAGDDASSISPNPKTATAGSSLPVPGQAGTATSIQPNATPTETAQDRPEVPAPTSMSLADVLNIMGAPPGVPLSEVGKSMTLSMSDAVRIIGAPPGTSPEEVGKTITLPLPTGPGKHP